MEAFNMKCAYCGEKFQAEDEVIVLKIEEVILHDGCCAAEYVFENYCSEVKTYIEYLEGELS
jgi:hypothetical protein